MALRLRLHEGTGNTGGERHLWIQGIQTSERSPSSSSLQMGIQKQCLGSRHAENGGGVGDETAESKREPGSLSDLGGQTYPVNLNFPLWNCV